MTQPSMHTLRNATDEKLLNLAETRREDPLVDALCRRLEDHVDGDWPEDLSDRVYEWLCLAVSRVQPGDDETPLENRPSEELERQVIEALRPAVEDLRRWLAAQPREGAPLALPLEVAA